MCPVVVLIVTFAGGPLLGQQPRPATAQTATALQIVVISGEDAVNIIQQKTAVAPIVEVRDRNNQPVAGAVVTFAIQGGRNATFAAGANTMTTTTNALGQAAVTGMTPTGAGAVQINVVAGFQGQTATAAITQTNFATAAQAASASSGSAAGTGTAGGGGGGLGAGAITGIAASAVGVAGGLYGYRKYQEGDPPVVSEVVVSPPEGVQGATPIFLGFGGTSHDATEHIFDFGDGTRISLSPEAGPPAPHIYQTAGTFTVSVTIHDKAGRTASGRSTVIIRSLTARWNVGNNFFTLVQAGSNITGTFTATSGQGSGTVSGTLAPYTLNSPSGEINLRLTITPTGAGSPGSFAGSTSLFGESIRGTLTISSTTSTVVLVRQ